MKEMKKLLLFMAILLFSFSACQKEEFIDKTDKSKPEPKETNSNPLVTKTVVGDDGIELGCFTINFTFELNVNGTNTSVASEDDFTSIMENIPTEDSLFSIDFVYPFDITGLDGVVSTITNEDELGQAFASCIPDEGWEEPGFPAFLINQETSCYDLSYPVSLTNGTETFTVATEQEFIDLYATQDFLSFVFPITLLGEDNITYEVSDENGLFALLAACCNNPDNPVDSTFNDGGFGTLACYDIVFPLSYLNGAGEVVVAVDEDAFTAAIFNDNNFGGFSYPMTLVDQAGIELVINSDEELNQAFEDCEFDPEPGILDLELSLLYYNSLEISIDSINFFSCYTIVYPITVTYGDVETALANEAEVVEELSNTIDVAIKYPISVIKSSDNLTVVLANENDLYALIEYCQ